MRRSNTPLLALATVLAVSSALIIGIGPAEAASSVKAVAKWSMVPQSKDANGDGFIDGDGGVPRKGALTVSPSIGFVGAGNHVAQPNERLINGALSWYLTDRGYPVRLNACDSSGRKHRWTIRPATGAATTTPWTELTSKKCATTVFLAEGVYTLNLQVKDGARTAKVSVTANVRNYLVLALGDSYASGEGNPRNVEAWLAGGALGGFHPYWDDDPCDRSTRGAPAQAAMALENSSAKSSVTLVYLACSGATVNQGVLGAQVSQGQGQSQVEQARGIIGDRQVDLITLSIGGNDVGFTSVLETCATTSNCPVSKAGNPPLSRYPTVQAGVQAETAALPGKYSRIAACFGAGTCTLADGRTIPALRLSADARVLPTLYPDITRAANGQPCSYFTMSSRDFAWARDTILTPSPAASYSYALSGGGSVSLPGSAGSLNQQVAATAVLPGWQPVTATWSASGDSVEGHGVCAGDSAWVFGATFLNGFSSASFHPDVTGQEVLARGISTAMGVSRPR